MGFEHDDEGFCDTHNAWHSREMADPDCEFDVWPWAGPEVIPGTHKALDGLTIRHNPK